MERVSDISNMSCGTRRPVVPVWSLLPQLLQLHLLQECAYLWQQAKKYQHELGTDGETRTFKDLIDCEKTMLARELGQCASQVLLAVPGVVITPEIPRKFPYTQLYTNFSSDGSLTGFNVMKKDGCKMLKRTQLVMGKKGWVANIAEEFQMSGTSLADPSPLLKGSIYFLTKHTQAN